MTKEELESNPIYWKEKYENIKFHYEQENQELKDLLKKIHKQRYTAKNTYTQEYYDLTDEIGKLLKQE